MPTLNNGCDIVEWDPLIVEVWGVRRSFVRAPDGVINIVQRHEWARGVTPVLMPAPIAARPQPAQCRTFQDGSAR
jgi:hypothetical protein